MSTKIYSGIRLPMMDIGQLQAFAARCRPVLQDIIAQRHQEFIARIATKLFDEDLLHQAGCLAEDGDIVDMRLRSTTSALSAASDKWYDRVDEAKKTNRRDAIIDTEITLCIFAHPSRDDQLLGMVFAGNNELNEAVMAFPEIEEYGYWNNTDEPEGMDQAEWQERGRVWDAVFPGNESPAEAGLTLTLISQQNYIPFPDDRSVFNALIPSYEDRVRQASRKVAQFHLGQEAKALVQLNRPSDWMEIVERAANPHEPWARQAEQWVRQVLPEQLDHHMLLAKDRSPWALATELTRGLPSGVTTPSRPRM